MTDDLDEQWKDLAKLVVAMKKDKGKVSLRKHAHAIYRHFFSAVKTENSIQIFLIFMLKTLIVGTR